jgi:hypothetical protein
MTSMETRPAPNLAPVQTANLDVAPPQVYELGAEGVGMLTNAFRQHIDGLRIDYGSAVRTEQSLDVMAAAALATEILTGALVADPQGYDAVNAYNGPIAEMSREARQMHTRQTGFNLPEVNFDASRTTPEQAVRILSSIGSKVNDRNWDGTGRPDMQADSMTAVGRKNVALAAAQGLDLIAGARGRIKVAASTKDKLTAYFSQK